jgi:hypothetical protein
LSCDGTNKPCPRDATGVAPSKSVAWILRHGGRRDGPCGCTRTIRWTGCQPSPVKTTETDGRRAQFFKKTLFPMWESLT